MTAVYLPEYEYIFKYNNNLGKTRKIEHGENENVKILGSLEFCFHFKMCVLAMVKILRSFEISYFHGDTVYEPHSIQYQLLYDSKRTNLFTLKQKY